VSFLAPLFLLGATAIALPIVFHLIRRTSRERIPFSSLMFLTPSPPRLTRRSRLENIFLLLLRCSILILLALAFARPFFRQPAVAQSSTSKRIVVLLDTSASMRREPLFANARARALEIAAKAGRGDELALVLFDRSTRTLVTFDDWNSASGSDRVQLVEQRLKPIQAGWAGTQLGHAIIAASEMIGQEGDSRPTEVFVVSDFQEGARLEGLQGYQWPRNVNVVAVPVNPGKTANAGVQLLAAPGTATAQPVKVRVSNSGHSTAEQFQLRWAGAASNTISIYVAPGQSRVAELPRPARTDRVVLNGDDADFDNTGWFALPRESQVNVAFAGANAPTDPQQAVFYLQRAFGSTANENVQLTVLTNSNPAAVSNTLLYIVAGAIPEDQITLITERVRQGATALWVAKSDTLAGLERATGLNVTADEAVLPNKYAMLSEIDFAHPLFTPFAEARFSDFTKIHFWKHRKLNFGQAESTAPRVIARFDSGDPAIAQVAAGKGTIFVLASGWQPAESQFALSSKFVPFLYALLEFSGAIKAQAQSYHVGDAIDLSRVAGPNKLTVRKPDGKTVEVPAGSFSDTEQPGIYTVTSVQPAFDLAVNVAPEESRTAPMAMEELQKLGVPMNVSLAESTERAARKAAQLHAAELESRQRAWRWLIAATLMVLMVETWIASRLSRRATLAVGT
jgi:hypothetical protein